MKCKKKFHKYKKILTSVYDAHKNEKNNNKNKDRRVIGIAQLC